MKKLLPIIAAIFLIVSAVGVSAGNAEKITGEVLYHQNFDDISGFGGCGIRIGSLSTDAVSVECPEDSLVIRTYDKGRVYIVLPDAGLDDSLTFTLEFSFRFTDIHSSNGYIAPILTCRGCDPVNITALTIRADGSVDDFNDADPALADAFASGETVNVKIPVISGAVDTILFETAGQEYSVERTDLLVISEGLLGFIVRNCDVEIDEIYIVNGVNYSEKSGYYADASYASEETPALTPECSDQISQFAPPTGDNSSLLIIIACVAMAGIAAAALLGRKKR